jgi:hypothetical protein
MTLERLVAARPSLSANVRAFCVIGPANRPAQKRRWSWERAQIGSTGGPTTWT